MLSRISGRNFNRKLGSRGVTLVNVIVGAAILTAVILSGLNLTGTVRRNELDTDITTKMLVIRENLIAFIENDEAWERTVFEQRGGATACLYYRTDCKALFNTWTAIDIYFPNSATAYYTPASNAAAGFKQKLAYVAGTTGEHPETCATWNTADRNCLYSVNVSYKPSCLNGTAPCFNPKVEIRGQFDMSALVSAGMPVNRIYKERYNFNFIRTSEKGYHVIVLRDYRPAGEAGGPNTGGSWIPRCLMLVAANIIDTGGDIVSFPADGTNCGVAQGVSTPANYGTAVTLRPGVYRCEFSAPAYQVNSHRAQLWNVTDGERLLDGSTEDSRNNDANASGLEQSKLMTRSSGSGQFTLSKDTEIRIEHWTQTTRGAVFGSAFQAFGKPAGFTTEVYSILKCIKEL